MNNTKIQQHGGGKCTICGANGATKATCPANPSALHPNQAKHPNAVKKAKSPSPARRSPSPARRRSPSPARRRSPSPARRSPSPARRRSPSPARRRSPSPARRSPSPARRSPSPARRSPSPARRSPSPARRSPSPARRSPSPRQLKPSEVYVGIVKIKSNKNYILDFTMISKNLSKVLKSIDAWKADYAKLLKDFYVVRTKANTNYIVNGLINEPLIHHESF